MENWWRNIPRHITPWEYIKNVYRGMKLKEKIRFLVMVLIFCYLLLFGIIELYIVSGSTTEYLNRNSQNAVELTGEYITGTFQNVSNMTKLIMGNEEVVNYMKGNFSSKDQGEGSKVIQENKVIQEIYGISVAFDDIYSVLLISEDNRYVVAGRDIVHMDRDALLEGKWKEKIDEKNGGYAIFLNGADIFLEFSGDGMVSFMRRVYDLVTQKPIGYIIVNMPSSILETALYKGIGSNSGGFMDSEGRYWGQGDGTFFSEIDLRGEGIVQHTERYFTHMEVLTVGLCANGSLHLVLYENITFISLLSGQINAILLLFFATGLISFLVLGVFINKTIIGPIATLSNSMRDVKSGWLHRVSMDLPNDEIGQLKNTYNEMLVEMNNLIRELVEKEKAARQAELEILQEQIKPHFLYNTLDTICYMTIENSPEEVYDAVETLGKFYRRFLSKGKDSITLGEEVEIVKDYVSLQKLRYGDLFEDVYEIPAELSGIRVPKLILQPFVENSIYHGIRPKGERCLLRVSAQRGADGIHIFVYDKGVGMERSEITKLLQNNSISSFGFKGTIERIQYFYHCENVCTIRSEKGHYCEIHIRLPDIGEEAGHV